MFAFRLCLALGFPHPDFLLRMVTSEQLAEWQAYFAMEPWGYPAEWARTGLLASTVANFSEISKKHDWKMTDFMPGREQKPDAKALAKKIASVFAGRAVGKVKKRR